MRIISHIAVVQTRGMTESEGESCNAVCRTFTSGLTAAAWITERIKEESGATDVHMTILNNVDVYTADATPIWGYVVRTILRHL